jgi:fructose/tagatose bisphosphate aldolase
VTVLDAAKLRGGIVDRLARTAVFASDAPTRDAARYVIREAARSLGACSASIYDLYMARGRGECGGFTVPAINVRALTYDTAAAIFRAAKRLDAGAVVFEIARSEIGYTAQRPAEYTACVLAAAIRESWTGPVFLQGDHYQFNAKKMASDAAAETKAVRDLALESVESGFLNIDIDASTLVDLSKPTLEAQQRPNFEPTAAVTEAIRAAQPPGVTISIGGEIGEVGKKNSTPEELTAYVDGYLAILKKRGVGPGIAKVSVQSGTTHGGVPLPDGTVAKVKIDFDTLEVLSRVCREKYGLAGAVQHGASTLPEEAFDHFPRRETAEIHLATGFQNIVYEHPSLPEELREKAYVWCREHCADERKEGETETQFLYKTRKKAIGPLKREFWDLPKGRREAIARDLEARFELLFRKLNVAGTRALVEKTIRRVDVPATMPAGLRDAGAATRR